MINKDTISGLLLFILAAGYSYFTTTIPDSTLSDEVGAGGLPRLLSATLFIVAALIVVKGIMSKGASQTKANSDDEAPLLRALGFVAIGFGYIVVAPLIGFAVGIGALLIAVAFYEGERLSPKLLAVATVTGLSFWAVFVKGLGTTQPTSWLLERLLGA